MPSQTEHMSVIVGGGPAGLTAALSLARYRHSVIVVDSPQPPRNSASRGVHGHLGMDGVVPAEFQARAWRELSGYGAVERAEGDAELVTTTPDGGFQVSLSTGETIGGRTVLLATGVIDEYPSDVEGFDECWGYSVIHCPFCSGEENAGGRWATVTDNAELAAMSAVAFRAWSENTIAICEESLSGLEAARESARSRGGDVVAGTIRRLHHRNGALYGIELKDGRFFERDTLVWTPRQQQQALVQRMAEDMKLKVDAAGFLLVDAFQCTSVPGLYAAGDVASQWKQSIAGAAAAGAAAADALHAAALLNTMHARA